MIHLFPIHNPNASCMINFHNVIKSTCTQIPTNILRRRYPSVMANYQKVTHVIFDLDGLTIDSERIYNKVYGDICSKYGKPYTWETRAKHMGTTDKDTAKIIVEQAGLPITVEEFMVDQSERLNKLLPGVKFMPGAERLIKHLSKNKIPIAVATSSTQPAFDLKTGNHKALFGLFHHIVAGGTDPEVKQGKPAPDIFLVCASRFPEKPTPDKVLVLEDAPNGVQAGRAAGMQVVMVPDSKLPAEKKKGATLVLNSLMDFKPELFGLPQF